MPFLDSLVRKLVCGAGGKPPFDDEEHIYFSIPPAKTKPSSREATPQQSPSAKTEPPLPPEKDPSAENSRQDENSVVPPRTPKQTSPSTLSQNPPLPSNAPPMVQLVERPRHIDAPFPVALQPSLSPPTASRTPSLSRSRTPETRRTSSTTTASQHVRFPSALFSRHSVPKTAPPPPPPPPPPPKPVPPPAFENTYKSFYYDPPQSNVIHIRFLSSPRPPPPPPPRRQAPMFIVIFWPPSYRRRSERVSSRSRPKTPVPERTPPRKSASPKSRSRSASPYIPDLTLPHITGSLRSSSSSSKSRSRHSRSNSNSTSISIHSHHTVQEELPPVVPVEILSRYSSSRSSRSHKSRTDSVSTSPSYPGQQLVYIQSPASTGTSSLSSSTSSSSHKSHKTTIRSPPGTPSQHSHHGFIVEEPETPEHASVAPLPLERQSTGHSKAPSRAATFIEDIVQSVTLQRQNTGRSKASSRAPTQAGDPPQPSILRSQSTSTGRSKPPSRAVTYIEEEPVQPSIRHQSTGHSKPSSRAVTYIEEQPQPASLRQQSTGYSKPPSRAVTYVEEEPEPAAGQDDAVYTLLRSQARAEGDMMRRCFDDSQKAYESGERAHAKDLSNQGKVHKAEMERLDKEAAEYIFRLNNVDCGPDEIDLHGLYVKEAVDIAEQALMDAKRRGAPQLRVIVGKGLHSEGAIAKIKPAIEGLMVKHHLAASLEPDNAGVLVVSLESTLSAMGASPAMSASHQIAVM